MDSTDWNEEILEKYLDCCFNHFKYRGLGLLACCFWETIQHFDDLKVMTWENFDGRNLLVRGLKIPLSEATSNMMAQQKEELGWQDYIFVYYDRTYRRFQPLTNYSMNYHTKRVLLKAGLPTVLNLTGLRKRAINNLLKAGVDRFELTALLGKKRVREVNRYFKEDQDMVDSAIEKIRSMRDEERRKILFGAGEDKPTPEGD